MPLPPIGPASATSLSATRAPAAGDSFARALEAAASKRSPVRPGMGADRAASAATDGLRAIERAQERLDALLAAARSGRTFTAAELIALQSQAYRCAQVVDLSARLVEQGAQAVKQALQAQV